MSTPSGLPAVRVARSAQDETIDLLTRHFAEDRLTLAEFERRTAAAIAARSPSELQAVVADLPALASGTAPPPAGVSAPQRVMAVLSSHEARGPLHLGCALSLRALLGNIEVDLRDTQFAPGVSEIDVSALLGNIELFVPLGVRVEMQVSSILGACESDATALPAPVRAEPRSLAAGGDVADARDAAAPVIRVTGRAILASVSVKSAVPR